MGGRHRSARSARHHHHHSPYHHPAHQQHIAATNALANPFRSPFADFGMSPFGLLGHNPLMGFGGGRNIFDEFEAAPGLAGPGGGMQGFTSMQTFSGSMGGGGMMAGGMGIRSSSTSTRFVNGKKITTKKYVLYISFHYFFLNYRFQI